jgi:hypothetical protein
LTNEDVATPKIDKWMGHTTDGIAGKYIRLRDEDLEKIAGTMGRLLRPVWSGKG